MGKQYAEVDVTNEIEKYINDVKELYNKSFVNWKGRVKGLNEQYSETIAEKLLESNIIKKFQTIEPIGREDYTVATHNGETKQKTNRREEIFAKELFRQGKEFGDIGDIGKIVDYQVPLKMPLKEKQTNRVGKIDLVSFHRDTETIYLIELKFSSSKDTLLKCTLEIATYYQQLHHQNFLKSEKFKALGAKSIKKALLIFKDSNQYKEYEEIKKSPNSKLKELIKKLEVEIFLIPLAPPYSAKQLDL